MFFYGIILCVAGLGAFGYMAVVSEFFYVDLGPNLRQHLCRFCIGGD